MKKDIVTGIGEVLWDMLPEGRKIGGAPANFAFHVAQFGFDSRVVSAVGQDEPGDEIIAELAHKRLRTLIERVPYPTGTVQVNLSDNGIPVYDIKENVAWDHIPFTESLRELASHTRAVCFGSLAQRSATSRHTISRFLETMPDGEDHYKIFDVNLRQNFYSRETLLHGLTLCNILKINDEELVTVGRIFGMPEKDMQEQCRALLATYHLRILILTCGAHGSYVFTHDHTSFIETPHVEVADTVGAGDSFTAAFTASLLSGKSVREAHQTAVRLAAFVCSQKGAMPVWPECDAQP